MGEFDIIFHDVKKYPRKVSYHYIEIACFTIYSLAQVRCVRKTDHLLYIP